MRLWHRSRRIVDPEIAPDEIFLDASNAPHFDRGRLEGRLEKPLSPQTFTWTLGMLGLLFMVLVGRAWNLQVANGASFAAQSAHNSLKVVTLFAPRGVIVDRNGTVIAENSQKDDGSVDRLYPYVSLSPILGYVSYPKKDSQGNYYDTTETGVAGLEQAFNNMLAGSNGQILTEMDVGGGVRSEGTIIPAKQGETLKLTVDAEMQQALWKAVSSTASAKRFLAGAGVVLDVHSGAIRAIVSYPSYDSNVMSDGSPAATIASYSSNAGRPFYDHAVQGVYAPGSIVKPLVSAGALTDGLITPNTVINDPGFLSLPDPYHPGKTFIYKGWKALGPVDVKKAIAWSSDVFFYTVGGGFGNQKGLGIDRLAYWYRSFGLGDTTNSGIPGEASGLIPTPEWKQQVFKEPWYLGDTYFTAIGQYSMQVTPIQMARAIAAVANGGRLYAPTVLAGHPPTFTNVP
ncbi:MAG TPA: penicillin-binding transpeptidase domain-containing protein, partial [Candidatus Paceibacterota bacterium]|nr:penicillin-binding transpeptidase domain-containing protein [Candidatus Paceibacterota bacterium]